MTLTEAERRIRELEARILADQADRMPIPARYRETFGVSGGGGLGFGVVRDIGTGLGHTVSVQKLKRKASSPYWQFDGAARTMDCCPDHTAADYEFLTPSPTGEFAFGTGFIVIWLALIDAEWVALPWGAPESILAPDAYDRSDAYPTGTGSGGGRSGTIPATVKGGTAAQVPSDISELSYTPADNSDWSGGADPGDADEALDQLADRIYTAETAITGKASTNHKATHITGGSDEIDGDKLDIDWTPSNYTPSTTPSEADDADNLTAHLYGVDQRLGTLAKRTGSIYVEIPTGSDDFIMFYTDVAITINKVRAVSATGSDYTTFNLKWRAWTAPWSGGTNIMSGSISPTSSGYTVPDDGGGFSDATIPANSVVCFVASAVSGPPEKLGIFVEFTVD